MKKRTENARLPKGSKGKVELERADEQDKERDENGRFLPGWKGGPGNPYARQVAALRGALYAAVTEDDIREIVRALIDKAKAGDVLAAREVLNRVMGHKEELVVEQDVVLDEIKSMTPLELARRAQKVIDLIMLETADEASGDGSHDNPT